MVTSLHDGMNLLAKEFVAASTIRENSVYLWAANLVSDLARITLAQENVNGSMDGSPQR